MSARGNAVTDDSIEENRFYEIGYLLSPAVAEDKLESTVTQLLVTPITADGGEVSEQNLPSWLTLAYPIQKVLDHKTTTFKTAWFGSIQFTGRPELAAKLNAYYKTKPEIVRFLLTDRPRPEPVASSAKEGKLAEPLDDAAIDREIDQLLAPTN